jgi:SAM-dependent methyltransferase
MVWTPVAMLGTARLYGGGGPGAAIGRRVPVGQGVRPIAMRIDYERSERWRTSPAPGRKLVDRFHGETSFSHPVRCTLPFGSLRSMPSALALPDASIDRIACLDVFEYVKDDVGLAAELARILAPGGRVRVRVPATGPLAGVDSLNLQRYLVDVSRRGERPPEIAELGWRRHYGEADLTAMFNPDELRVVSLTRRGLALGEVATFGAIFLFRWLWPNPERYQAAKRVIATLERFERRVVTPFGFSLEATFERIAERPATLT